MMFRGEKFSFHGISIAVVGMGYVGLPLAVELGKVCSVIGFDLSERRIDQLRVGYDITREIDNAELGLSENLNFTSKLDDIKDCNVFIVAVPTPIDASNRPDLRALLGASKNIGSVLKRGDVVIYESTVYPGCTEEECVPMLESVSGLIFNDGFHVGYSPERINPGDKVHTVTSITKITSGSTPEAAEFVDHIYSSIVAAGTYMAPSIAVAEAAKVIENTQRDVNIALMNELAILFKKLNIDTSQVLEAAGTKWNFLPFRPGLVGGHCIGVDPHYLTFKAEAVGYRPEMILAGRRLNDSMASYVASQLIKTMVKKRHVIHGSRILIMGFSFKENCPDIRNTKVIDIVEELREFGASVEIYDPWVDKEEAKIEYGLEMLAELPLYPDKKSSVAKYDAIVMTVAHSEFADMDIRDLRSLGTKNHVLYDVKNIFPIEESDIRL